MTDPVSRFAALTAAIIGMDFALGPDTTVYWPRKPKPDASNPKKRAKVKAARKQRNRK